MALIHEKLYRSTSLDKIDFGEYLDSLADNLFSSYNSWEERIRLELDIQSVFLNIETANPCGLIVNELLTNSLKHGFPDNRQGTLSLSLHQDTQGQITLTVRDDGIGFPEHLDFHNVESLGMELICTLTEQIQGKIELHRENGTAFTLTFSERQYRKRW
jgi:two-component sensor histidine kinase